MKETGFLMSDYTASLSRSATAPRRKAARTAGKDGIADGGERRQAMIDAAEALFLDHGYHETTMDDIARRAHVSKKTIYLTFPSKEALFEELVRNRRLQLYRPIVSTEDPVDDLREALHYLVGLVLAPREIAIHRLIAAESRRAPELAEAFHRQALGCGMDSVEQVLLRLVAAGQCDIADPRETARMLVGMALGEYHMVQLLGVEAAPSPAMIDRRVRDAVAILVRGTTPRPPGTAANDQSDGSPCRRAGPGPGPH